jgi:hypothetical protein
MTRNATVRAAANAALTDNAMATEIIEFAE